MRASSAVRASKNRDFCVEDGHHNAMLGGGKDRPQTAVRKAAGEQETKIRGRVVESKGQVAISGRRTCKVDLEGGPGRRLFVWVGGRLGAGTKLPLHCPLKMARRASIKPCIDQGRGLSYLSPEPC